MTLRTEFDDQDGYNAYAVDAVHQEVLSWLKTVVQASATVIMSTVILRVVLKRKKL